MIVKLRWSCCPASVTRNLIHVDPAWVLTCFSAWKHELSTFWPNVYRKYWATELNSESNIGTKVHLSIPACVSTSSEEPWSSGKLDSDFDARKVFVVFFTVKWFWCFSRCNGRVNETENSGVCFHDIMISAEYLMIIYFCFWRWETVIPKESGKYWFFMFRMDCRHIEYNELWYTILYSHFNNHRLTLRAAISDGNPCIMRTISLNKTNNICRISHITWVSIMSIVWLVQYIIPWSSSTGPLGSPFVPSCVVLSDPALRVHSEADINTAFEFRISAVQHVHTKEAFHLDYHCRGKLAVCY